MPEIDRGRPGEKAAPRSNGDTQSVPPSTHNGVARCLDSVVTGARRRRWAYSIMRRTAEPPPSYGSSEWLALPEGDPARVAGVVVAADCWARAGDTLEDDLRLEVHTARLAHKRAEDAEYRQRAEAHRETWSAPTRLASFADRRRTQLDAVAPRAGDHPGVPVPWLPELMCDADCGMSLVVDPDGCGDGCRAGNLPGVAS